ncbi:hypothetical protein [Ottowia testudinis]|uniref:Uncharacterized protein n=1 Tax=Ottowia testudinis TaxID=2816950 RepID=A0A975CD37_9BURK|nr:hypothetical protein [Ottowia testudinis]QTD44180.1 hypothetical protein J1M35_13720 [Ottowia testudinis]
MDVPYEVMRFGFAFVLGMLAVGLMWKGEITLWQGEEGDERHSRLFTGPLVRAMGAGWLVAALLGMHSLAVCVLTFLVVSLGGFWWLLRTQP